LPIAEFWLGFGFSSAEGSCEASWFLNLRSNLLSLRCLDFSLDLEEERRWELCYRLWLSLRLLAFLFLLFILIPHDDIFYPLIFISSDQPPETESRERTRKAIDLKAYEKE
jgi:hypothetical protein